MSFHSHYPDLVFPNIIQQKEAKIIGEVIDSYNEHGKHKMSMKYIAMPEIKDGLKEPKIRGMSNT